jgi:hypothetical protein
MNMCLLKFCEEANSYGYEDKPNYSKLIFLLSTELFEIGIVPDTCYTWVASNRYFYGVLLQSEENEEENESVLSKEANCKYDEDMSNYYKFFK